MNKQNFSNKKGPQKKTKHNNKNKNHTESYLLIITFPTKLLKFIIFLSFFYSTALMLHWVYCLASFPKRLVLHALSLPLLDMSPFVTDNARRWFCAKCTFVMENGQLFHGSASDPLLLV